MIVIKSVPNSNKFKLNGVLIPKQFYARLLANNRVGLENIHTGKIIYNLGKVESIIVDNQDYDNPTSQTNRITEVVY